MLAAVLLQNEAALAWDESEKGSFNPQYIPPHRIPTVPHEPWQDRNIRLPMKTREGVIEFLKEKLKSGLYEKSQSAYRSAFFAVEKKNGKIRLVHDLQKLNSVTRRDAGLPPIMDEMTEEIAGRWIYTGLDAFAGYDQVELEVSSRDYTSFESPIGTLRLRRMPQGWTNAVAAFQRVMTFVLGEEIPNSAVVYIDDVTVLGAKDGRGPEGQEDTAPGTSIRLFVLEHAQALNRVLHRMKRFGGTYSGGKLNLGVKEVEIVGYVCSRYGRRLPCSATGKIEKWPACRNIKEVRGFLGTVGTARNWVPNYGRIARPLVDLTKLTHTADFVWTGVHDKAMADIKAAVLSSGYIRPIDYTRIKESPPIVAVDASQIGCGIELAQVDEQGKRRPARFMSVYFSEVQQRYSQPKLELWGVFCGLQAVRHWILGCHFTLEVDCTSIKQMIANPSNLNSVEARWVSRIKFYDFKLVHVPGEKHKVPDGLSRRPPADDDSEQEDMDEALQGIDLVDVYRRPENIAIRHRRVEDDATRRENPVFPLVTFPRGMPRPRTPSPPPDEPDFGQESRDENNGDVFFKHWLYEGDWLAIGYFLSTGQWTDDVLEEDEGRLLKKARASFLRDGKIFWNRANQGPLEVILDFDLQRRLLKEAHEECGHRGDTAVYMKLRDRFYWPDMHKSASKWVKSCPECQARDYRSYEDKRLPGLAATAWGLVNIDCMAMGNDDRVFGSAKSSGRDGQPRYIVIARDDLTGWPEARAIPDLRSETIENFFHEEVLCRHGMVGAVRNDGGSEFRGAFESALIRLGIRQARTASYHPQANGMVERGNRPIKEAVLKLARGTDGGWARHLPAALYADRITVRRSTGHSPYYLLCGQLPVLPMDLEFSTSFVRAWERVTTREELLVARAQQLTMRNDILEDAASNLEISRSASVVHSNRRRGVRRDEVLERGDLVLVRNSAQDQGHEVRRNDRYFGPYRISRVLPGRAYELEELDGTHNKDWGRVAHNRIRRFHLRENTEVIRRSDADGLREIHIRANRRAGAPSPSPEPGPEDPASAHDLDSRNSPENIDDGWDFMREARRGRDRPSSPTEQQAEEEWGFLRD